MKNNPFESIFQDFVLRCGGEVLSEAVDGYTADYFFRKHNVVAELKTLMVDQSDDLNRKLTPEVEKWTKKYRLRPPGVIQGDRYIVTFADMPPEIQAHWLKLLKASVEPLVRDANRQIRDTKNRMTLPSAKGVMLIANQANLYHEHPDSFRQLIAEILRKRTKAGDLRYPCVNAVTYFSLKDVKSRGEGMYFWANLQMSHAPDEDVSPVVAFQKELQQAWYL